MRVFPMPGLKVRDPAKRDFLPEEGREVGDADVYWIRRLAAGDATTNEPKAESSSRSKGVAAGTNDGSQTA